MKKNFSKVAVALALAVSISFTSCIGSFNLTKKVYNWNNSMGDKWVNEVVFVALCIVPIYEISTLADVVVFNLIEFWTGDNPVAEVGEIKKVKGENGAYSIETMADGYNIKNETGDEMNLIYNQESKTWNSVINGQETKLIQFEDENNVIVFLSNGEERNVELSSEGVLAFRESLENESYYASR